LVEGGGKGKKKEEWGEVRVLLKLKRLRGLSGGTNGNWVWGTMTAIRRDWLAN